MQTLSQNFGGVHNLGAYPEDFENLNHVRELHGGLGRRKFRLLTCREPGFQAIAQKLAFANNLSCQPRAAHPLNLLCSLMEPVREWVVHSGTFHPLFQNLFV